MTQTIANFRAFAGMFLFSAALFAQQEPAPASALPEAKPAESVAKPAAPADGSIPIDKRVFGVLPNYRTADGTATYQPISSKRKLWIGFKDSFDYPVYFTSAMFAGINQMENTSPSFGQGLKGYGRRYLTSYADQTIGNMMTESFYPIMLKQDPRYFSVGKTYGGVWKRTGYALTRVLICRSDKGTSALNFSEILGNSTAVAISNIYYTENRNAGDNVQKLGIQVGTDAISNVLKEFWPDIKKKYFNKKNNKAD